MRPTTADDELRAEVRRLLGPLRRRPVTLNPPSYTPPDYSIVCKCAVCRE
jgi:hypothetical protein